jgi:hypothetical protein
MKYNDRQTQLLKRKHESKISDTDDWFERQSSHQKKVVKDFTKRVLSCGVDPDFWGFVSKDDKYHLCCNYSILKRMERVEGKDETTLYDFIQNNKNKLGVDPAKVREKKLNRLIS